MKISICIPQFNRVEFLKIGLLKIAEQKDAHLEIVISDDASTDNTTLEISNLKKTYPFPILYFRFDENMGYDRNLRKSLELATGDYCFILGNDDTLNGEYAIRNLARFLELNDFPDIGFCNSTDYLNPRDIQFRAKETAIIGSGVQVALKYYSSFSFVAGLIFKKSAFEQVNTGKLDGSIYVQMYLACLIIIKGGMFFTVNDALVLKDIRIGNNIANSYIDTLPRKKTEYKILDAGLPSYAHTCAMAFRDSGLPKLDYYYKIVKRIYQFTYPFWLINYRKNEALVAALGLKEGLKLPRFKDNHLFSISEIVKLKFYYSISTFLGLYTPISFFDKLKKQLYKVAKS